MVLKIINRSKRKAWLITWVLLLVIGFGHTAYDLLIAYPKKHGQGIGQILEIEILSGIGPSELSDLLETKGLINSTGKFKLWLRFSGLFPFVKAGTFSVKDNMSPKEIISILSGKSIYKGIRVTIAEGFTLSKIGNALEKAGSVSKTEFIAAALDKKLLKELSISLKTAEGFLFPDTYYFDNDATAKDIIKIMNENFKKKFASFNLSRISNSKSFDINQIITLASIVQSEARLLTEAPVIAGVYKNRLDKNRFHSGLMQADPTVAYGCEPYIVPRAPSCLTFKKTLGRKQLSDLKNPYNTYKHAGLPPGPICCPGKEAIEAAIKPKDVSYLYFVAGEGGSHRFSETLEKHNKAVKLYRQGRN